MSLNSYLQANQPASQLDKKQMLNTESCLCPANMLVNYKPALRQEPEINASHGWERMCHDLKGKCSTLFCNIRNRAEFLMDLQTGMRNTRSYQSFRRRDQNLVGSCFGIQDNGKMLGKKRPK